jgi:hypothetical protein
MQTTRVMHSLLWRSSTAGVTSSQVQVPSIGTARGANARVLGAAGRWLQANSRQATRRLTHVDTPDAQA